MYEKSICLENFIYYIIPKALEDGFISMDEIVGIVKDICNILDIPIDFKLPDEFKNINIAVLPKE